jgi:MFS family permease
MSYFNSIKRRLNGVFYGWWIVAASFFLFIICGGTAFAGFTTFFNPISEEFNWSAAQVSLAFSLRSLEFGVMAPLVGFVLDRVGARKVIVFGVVVTSLSIILLSRTNSLAYFYIIFIAMSIGTSCCIGLGQFVAVANWFVKRRTWAMAVMSAGWAFSGVVGPVMVWLINQYQWRSSLVIVGMVMLVLGLPLALVIRHRPEPYGYLPDGETVVGDGDTTAAGTEGIAVTGEAPQAEGLTVREALVTRTFWMLLLFSMLNGFAQSSMMVHEMPYLTSIGFTREIAGWALFGITGFSLVGRLSSGRLGDTHDKRYLLAAGAALQAAGVLIFARMGNPLMLIPFIMLYGPGYGSQMPLWPAIRADYFGLRAYATIGGLQSLGWTVCGVLAPFLAGWAFDSLGSYRPIWLAYAIASAVAIPVAFMIKTRRD